ncbi:hypothetical protein M758_11G150400 [Ceratodon purpureus]|uniref:Uncharacterized protein n=1 Tax=Ceratodon purpureus TaxID=3225 RepID=A0A8T0GFH5_CERPU|nr:hypothetical protein KC19_11G174200 [Ceratodon purpureus]KAG0601953.1 hypothetical protein M758_11G150400 [Ceratodon purpureus]
MASTNSQQEEIFKPISSTVSADDAVESHGRREDLTADTEVKAPGIVQRVVEEVEAIASEVWAAITPSKK